MAALLNLLHRDKLSALSLPHLGGVGPKSTKPTEPTMARQQCFIAKPTHLGRQDEIIRTAVRHASTSRAQRSPVFRSSRAPCQQHGYAPDFHNGSATTVQHTRCLL